MVSGGLTFTQDAGGTLGAQPVKYQATGSSNNAGGTYLFRSDSGPRSAVSLSGKCNGREAYLYAECRNGGKSESLTGVFRSTTFTLGPGEITFDYSGNGGYVALCKGDECKKFQCDLRSKTMFTAGGSFSTDELAPWVGADVYFKLVDDSTSNWGYIAVDNLVYPFSSEPTPSPGPAPSPEAAGCPTECKPCSGMYYKDAAQV
jgi:hypothetical protein